MIWLRKGIVHFLAFLLLISLLSTAWSLGINRNLGTPDKVKTLLADSKVYDKAVAAVLSGAQDDKSSDTSISLKDPTIQDSAKQSFTPELLRGSTNKFIDGNYAWLTGKTAKPEFNIDLTKAKEDFATKVGKYVEDHLAGLQACTPEQTAKLQIPVDPLTVECRPANLDAKTEGARVATEVRNSDFLSEPMVTADTIGNDKNSQDSKPYYQKLTNAPKLFQIGQKLPIILGVLSLVLALAIVVIAPERRRGWRRVGVVVFIAGLLLIVSKFIGDFIVNRVEHQHTANTLSTQLTQPRNDVLHHLESSIVQINLLFGIVFIVLALIILISLYRSRSGRPQKSKVTEVPAPKSTPGTPDDKDQASAPELSNRLRQPGMAPSGSTRKPKRPPRLIQ